MGWKINYIANTGDSAYSLVADPEDKSTNFFVWLMGSILRVLGWGAGTIALGSLFLPYSSERRQAAFERSTYPNFFTSQFPNEYIAKNNMKFMLRSAIVKMAEIDHNMNEQHKPEPKKIIELCYATKTNPAQEIRVSYAFSSIKEKVGEATYTVSADDWVTPPLKKDEKIKIIHDKIKVDHHQLTFLSVEPTSDTTNALVKEIAYGHRNFKVKANFTVYGIAKKLDDKAKENFVMQSDNLKTTLPKEEIRKSTPYSRQFHDTLKISHTEKQGKNVIKNDKS